MRVCVCFCLCCRILQARQACSHYLLAVLLSTSGFHNEEHTKAIKRKVCVCVRVSLFLLQSTPSSPSLQPLLTLPTTLEPISFSRRSIYRLEGKPKRGFLEEHAKQTVKTKNEARHAATHEHHETNARKKSRKDETREGRFEIFSRVFLSWACVSLFSPLAF